MLTDKKIIEYSDLKRLRNKFDKAGLNTVFTSGCFDLLHLGHIVHLNYCKSQGDVLIVSVGNDKLIKKLKGNSRPILDEETRLRTVAALDCVDYVVLSQESDNGCFDHKIMVQLLIPDIYIINNNDKALEDKKQMVNGYGGKFITCVRVPPENLKNGISTTEIIDKIRSLK